MIVIMAELKDSGQTREFGTGAHRDAAIDKGRCDLIPLDILAIVLKSNTVKCLHEFYESFAEEKLTASLYAFAAENKVPVETVLLEASKQYEDGATKYGENNWKQGIPCHVFLDCAVRHYIKWHRGDKDEPHDRAFMWNVLGLMWTMRNKPDMNDLRKNLAVVNTAGNNSVPGNATGNNMMAGAATGNSGAAGSNVAGSSLAGNPGMKLTK